MAGFQNFWGKARPGTGDGPAFHPLAWHLLDVAAVLDRLFDIPDLVGGVPGDWRGLLVFLATLHDVGKFTRSFQALAPEHWPAALGPFAGRIGAPRHDTLGWMILAGKLRIDVEACFPGWGERQLDALLRAVTGHHGRPPEEDAPRLLPEVFCPVCEQAVRDLLCEVHALLAPQPVTGPTIAEAKRLSWLVAGLVNLADWIGSATPPFRYERPDAYGLPAYWALARERAQEAVAASGLLPAAVAPAGGLRTLFPQIAEPSPMQAWAETVKLPAGPALVLIEDATGSGKTEAALLLAHRMMAERRAGGVFFALPTMATANAMFERLGESYRRLFASGTNPSLVLAHGRTTLHDGFRSTILSDATPAAAVGEEEVGEVGAEAAGPSCAAWIADDRRKAFLAEIGAGTIDQALLATLPSRHAALRLLGLSRRVLIVDEAHAYDPYMRAELRGLLRFQRMLGGSAIVLSATLPQAQRRELAETFTEGHGAKLVSTAYPLATVLGADLAAEDLVVDRRPTSRRRIAVRRLPDMASAIAAIEAASPDAAIAWVRNTVDDAIEASEALRQRGLEVTLFHARFAMADRIEIEQAVLGRFGKTADEKRRGIVVATQVIEQSLDLDFDMMVTDLAPIELLIQRAGRLWRHARTERPVAGPELLVLSPEPVAEPPADWLSSLLPGTERVYRDPGLLWRSARVLFAAGAIETPGGIRALIEPVYAENAEAPPGLQAKSDQATGKNAAAGRLGTFNLLKPEDGYCRTTDGWEDDVRTPTRLSEGTITVRLARLEGGRVVPWAAADSPERAWALSEVSVRAKRLGSPVLDPALAARVEQVKIGWPRFLRETPVLVLVPAPDGGWEAEVRHADGPLHTVRYRRDRGVLWTDRKGSSA